MKVVGRYSFNQGAEVIQDRYPHLLQEVYQAIEQLNGNDYKTKSSREKTKLDKILYSPIGLNKGFKQVFSSFGWEQDIRITCEYPSQYYVEGYQSRSASGAFRSMDFRKEKLGVEVQFGKYAFMVYNVCAKMTIFRNEGIIEAGIEIVPIKEFASQMSSGVSYFEQFVWDLEHRGVSDIDIPVLILGII